MKDSSIRNRVWLAIRTLIGCFVGIAVIIAVGSASTWVGKTIGVPSFIEFKEPIMVTRGNGPASYDEEVDSVSTAYGLSSILFAMVVGLWAGQAAYYRRWDANFTPKEMLMFCAGCLSLVILIVMYALVHLAFRGFSSTLASYLRDFIEISALAGVTWSVYQWYKKRCVSLPRQERR